MKRNRMIYKVLLGIVSMILISCSPKTKDTIEWDSKDTLKVEESDIDHSDINEYYAGIYYDEEGKLICCYTDELEKVQEYMHIPVAYRKVNFNLNQLNDTFDAYSAHIGTYGIQSVAISHSDNGIIVTLEDFDRIEEIKENIQGEAVIFQLKDPNMEVVFTMD